MFTHLSSLQKGNVGRYGEDVAVAYLKNNNYTITYRNWCNTRGRRLGEIDIIAKQNDTIIFVEVKSRYIKNEELSQTRPEEQITQTKLYKLNKVAQKYIAGHRLWDKPWQFDAISVVFTDKKPHKHVRHLKNIFF